jgi:hypothetical protein
MKVRLLSFLVVAGWLAAGPALAADSPAPKAGTDAPPPKAPASISDTIVEVIKLQKEGKTAQALEVFDQGAKENPAGFKAFVITRLHLLVQLDPAAARAEILRLCDTDTTNNPRLFMSYARILTDPKAKSHDYDLAVRLAERCINSLPKPNYALTLTYADVLFTAGQVDKAIAVAKDGIALLEKDDKAPANHLSLAKARLQRMEAAKKGKSPPPSP